MSRKKTLTKKEESEKYNKYIRNLSIEVMKEINMASNRMRRKEWDDPDVILRECSLLENKYMYLSEGTVEERKIYQLVLDFEKSQKSWYPFMVRISNTKK